MDHVVLSIVDHVVSFHNDTWLQIKVARGLTRGQRIQLIDHVFIPYIWTVVHMTGISLSPELSSRLAGM